MRIAFALGITLNLILGIHNNVKRRILCSHVMHRGGQRQLSDAECATIWPEGTGPLVPWTRRFPPREHPNNPNGSGPTSEVGFVVIFTDCPEDAPSPGDDDTDPVASAGSFVDRAAVTKHVIACAIPSMPSTSATDPAGSSSGTSRTLSGSASPASSAMYALIHPDAVICIGPNGEEYDRATLLQNLGYWVKIWDSPVDENSLYDQPYIADHIEDDVGLKDLMKLQALKLDDHEFVVIIDKDFVLKNPLDPVFDELRESDDIAAFVRDPDTGAISTDMLVMKPSVDTYNDLIDTFKTVPFTGTGGWGDSGIGTQPGGMGTSGLLDYFMSDPEPDTDPNPHTGTELDRCKYANNADENCNTTPFEDIVGFSMTDDLCGQPWMCTYGDLEETWSPETKVLCETFLVHWIKSREEFEHLFFNQPTSDNYGDFHKDVYHGLCTGRGPSGYIPMLDEMIPEQENCIDGSLEFHGCNTEYTTDTATSIGNGIQLEVSVTSPQQCEVYTAGPNNAGADVPIAGTAEVSGISFADTSMVFVIDRSGSTCDETELQCSGDENRDGGVDDILDCEIAATLDLVHKVRDEGTVKQVGLVSFSHKLGRRIDSATVELPLTDINDFDDNQAHAIETAMRNINCGGATNYAKAVEKACEVIETSTATHNIIVFMSSGIPTRGGAPAAYCSNNAIFHTIALGTEAKCEEGVDISLSTISKSTQGTCQEVLNVADIRQTLKEISDAQFRSVQGSTVASESSVHFGCEDVPNYVNLIGVDCANMSYFCGGSFAGSRFANNLGITGDSACCICGGGVYLEIGDLELFDDENFVSSENSLDSTSFQRMASIHPGIHTVCTTVIASEAGVPGANVQCKNILVCPHQTDY